MVWMMVMIVDSDSESEEQLPEIFQCELLVDIKFIG